MASREAAEANAAKTSVATAALIDAAPAAVKKLQEKSGDCMKLTMTELSALAFKYFKGTVLKGNKAQHVKTLGDLMKAQPHVMQLAATQALAAPPVVTAPIEQAIAPTLATPTLATPPNPTAPTPAPPAPWSPHPNCPHHCLRPTLLPTAQVVVVPNQDDEDESSSDEEGASEDEPDDLDEDERVQLRALREHRQGGGE